MQISKKPQFPVLKLPSVVRCQLLRHLDPIKLIELSLLSKTSQKCVRSAIPRNQIKIQANFRYKPTVFIHLGNRKILWEEHCYVIHFEYMKERNGYLEKRNELIECGDNTERMRTTWIQIWSDFLCQTFNCVMYSVCIHPQYCIESVSSILNWVNTRQQSIENLIISGEEIGVDDLSLALSTCTVNHYLYVSTRTVDEIKPLNPTIKTDYIRLVGVPSVSWLSIDNIIASDCVHIDLSYFKFDEMGLNQYLKAWINGCNPRLEYLKSYFYFVDLEEALHDIEKENGPQPKRFYTHDNLCLPFDAEEGITIRRNNGDLATIKQEFAKTPYSIPRIQYFFTFVVWNSS